MNRKVSHQLRATVLLIVLSLFAVLVFESFQADHEENCHEENCHEEDCPICLVLQIIHNTNKIADSTPLTSVEFSAFSYINLFIISALLLAPATLVKQKVKLVI